MTDADDMIVIELREGETLEEWFDRAAELIKNAPENATLVLPSCIAASLVHGGDA